MPAARSPRRLGAVRALLAAIHERLLPQALLAERDASAFARAGDAARAFGASAVAPPGSLVAGVSADAVALLARARARLG